MPSNAIAAINTFLKAGDGGTPETFTTVAEVKTMGGPSMAVNVIDVTNHSSTVPWREKIATLLDPGVIPFTVNFNPVDPTQDFNAGLLNYFTQRKKKNWKLVMTDPGNTTFAFAAYVTKFNFNFPIDGIIEAQIELTLTGQPTLAG
jgi:predicted secreted protein